MGSHEYGLAGVVRLSESSQIGDASEVDGISADIVTQIDEGAHFTVVFDLHQETISKEWSAPSSGSAS